MTSSNLSIRLDDTLRNEATAILAEYGLSPSQAIKLFFNQVVATKKVPLSFDWQATEPKTMTIINQTNALEQLEKELMQNTFADEIRQNLYFHRQEYENLIEILKNIAIHCKGVQQLNKNLVLYLYEIPKMVFVWKENLKAEKHDFSELIDKLEDAWLELDVIIAEEILNPEL